MLLPVITTGCSIAAVPAVVGGRAACGDDPFPIRAYHEPKKSSWSLIVVRTAAAASTRLTMISPRRPAICTAPWRASLGQSPTVTPIETAAAPATSQANGAVVRPRTLDMGMGRALLPGGPAEERRGRAG